jgi:hypothetical protein
MLPGIVGGPKKINTMSLVNHHDALLMSSQWFVKDIVMVY